MRGRLQPWVMALAYVVLFSFALCRGVWSRAKVLHADEAVQWSLARDLVEGAPYSANEDRFHGPTLAMATVATSRLTGVAFVDMSPPFLGGIAMFFLLLLSLAALALPGLSWRRRWLGVALCFLTGGFTPYGYYFIQEILLVAGLVWGVVLWMRLMERPLGSASRLLPLLSGVAFGFACASKVTAVAYLIFFFSTVWWLRRESLKPKTLGWFVLGLIGAWAFFQSVAFTDLPGLLTWWKQLQRAFGVAAGTSADTLPAESYSPWIWVAVWLTFFGLLRWAARAELGRFGRASVDFPLALSVLIFLFHLALPYKTPWLLLGAVSLPLVLAWPALFQSDRLGALGVAVLMPVAFWQSSVFMHTPTRPEVPGWTADLEAMAQAYGPERFFVAVEGGHCWPLPYYLRRLRVGFGSFEGAAKAPVRLLAVTDQSEPSVLGYVVRRVTLRAGEDYWLLVAKGYEGHLIHSR